MEKEIKVNPFIICEALHLLWMKAEKEHAEATTEEEKKRLFKVWMAVADQADLFFWKFNKKSKLIGRRK